MESKTKGERSSFEKFERGYFKFYNLNKKKELYLKGKKYNNYNVVKQSFIGRFVDGYAVDEQEYRDAKMKDTLESEAKLKKPTEKDIKVKYFQRFYNEFKDIKEVTKERLANVFEITTRTINRWLNEEYEDSVKESQDTKTKI